MAARYWVGGSGTWDASTTTHWSASSGGAGGASVPTSADDVYFNASSGGGAVTITYGTANAKSLDLTGWTGSFGYNQKINVYAGNINLGNVDTPITIDWSMGSSTVSLSATGDYTTNCEITIPSGQTGTINQTSSILRGIGITCWSSISWNTNNYTLGNYNASYMRFYYGTFNAGSSTVYAYSLETSGGTINGSSMNLICYSFNNGGYGTNNTYYNVYVKYPNVNISRDITVNNFTCGEINFINEMYIYPGKTMTVNGTFTATVGTQSSPLLIRSAPHALSSRPNLVLNGARNVTYCDFQNIQVVGTTLSGTSLRDGGGNSNISFETPKTVYGISGGGYSLSSGGSPISGYNPRLGDTIRFDSNTPSPFNIVAGSRFTNLDCTGYTGTITGYPKVYGDVTLSANTSVTAGLPIEIRASNRTASFNPGGATGYDIAGYFTSGASLSLSGNVNCRYFSINDPDSNPANDSQLLNINTNNYNITANGINITSKYLFNMGSSTIVHKPTQNVSESCYFYCKTDPGTSTFRVEAQENNRTIRFAFDNRDKQVFNIFQIGGTAAGVTYDIGLGQSCTMNEFKVTNISSPTFRFTPFGYSGNVNNYIFGKFTAVGSAGNIITLTSHPDYGSGNFRFTYTGVGKVESNYLSVSNSTASPDTTWYAGADSTLSNTQGWYLAIPSGNGLFFGSNF